jgi:hypothetical protein
MGPSTHILNSSLSHVRFNLNEPNLRYFAIVSESVTLAH